MPLTPNRHNTAIPLSIICSYGGLGLPLAVIGLPLVLYLPQFYQGEQSLDYATVAWIILLTRLYDLITDPVLGMLSDRVGSRWGLRRSWVVAGSPLLMVGAWQLFNPPIDAGWPYLLGWWLLTYTGWTIVQLPYAAWGASYSDDYLQRSRMAAGREGFVLAGVIIAVLAPVISAESGGDARQQFAAIGWVMLLSLPVALIILLWKVPEPTRRPAQNAQLNGLQAVLRNRAFLRLWLAYFCNHSANALPASLFLPFSIAVLGLADPAQQGSLLLAYFVAGLIALPIWLWLARRWGKHRSWAVSMLWAGAVFALTLSLDNGDYVPFLLVCVGSGLSLAVDSALPAAIQADVIDQDTLDSGQQREGLYFGLWGMATKLALAVAPAAGLFVLGMVGFDSSLGHQNSDMALLTVSLLYCGVPVVIKLLAVALVWNFPLDATQQALLQERLRQQRTTA